VIEYWVMRIVRAKESIGPEGITVAEWKAYKRGDLQMVNGDLVEPIEEYDDQHDAEARALHEHGRTGNPHKVVLNAEIADLQ
jgi:hypothetical protein